MRVSHYLTESTQINPAYKHGGEQCHALKTFPIDGFRSQSTETHPLGEQVTESKTTRNFKGIR